MPQDLSTISACIFPPLLYFSWHHSSISNNKAATKKVLYGSSRGRSSVPKSWFCCNVIKHLPKIQTTERLIQIQYAGLGWLVASFINKIFFCSFYDMPPFYSATLFCGPVELSSEIQYWVSGSDAKALIHSGANIISQPSRAVCNFRRLRCSKKEKKGEKVAGSYSVIALWCNVVSQWLRVLTPDRPTIKTD